MYQLSEFRGYMKEYYLNIAIRRFKRRTLTIIILIPIIIGAAMRPTSVGPRGYGQSIC